MTRRGSGQPPNPRSLIRAAAIVATVMLATFAMACSPRDEAAAVSGQRQVIPMPPPTPTQEARKATVSSGQVREVEPARAMAKEIRPILDDSTYQPGWLVWIDWTGTIAAIDLEPQSDRAFAFETGITNLREAAITPRGAILVDGDAPDTEIFVGWSGEMEFAPGWLVDSTGAPIAIELDGMRNLDTAETIEVTDTSVVPPRTLSDTGPYIEFKGETYEWTWDEGLQRVGPGGVAAWSTVPAPVVVLRDLCDLAEAPCPLGAFLPGDEARPDRGGVVAPNHEAGGYTMAPDRHAAVAQSQTGWELISVDGDRTPLTEQAETSQSWWLSGGTAHWGSRSELVAVVGEDLAFFDGTSGEALGTAALPGSLAAVAFVDIDPGEVPAPATARLNDDDAVTEPGIGLTPEADWGEADVSFLEQTPAEVAEAFRRAGLDEGWVVASLGQDFLAVDAASGASRRARLPNPTAAYAVTPFGIAALDDADRLVLVGWSESDDQSPDTASKSIVLSDALPRRSDGEQLSIHRDPDGVEIAIATSNSQTVAVTLGPESSVRTLASDPTVGDWPFGGGAGSGPLVMPFAGQAKEYSWSKEWSPTGYDRILLSGARYVVAETCQLAPDDCVRQLIDRTKPSEPRNLDIELDPVALSPDESSALFRNRVTPAAAVALDTATGDVIGQLSIPDEVIAVLNDDLVLTLGETYELYSLEAEQAVLRARSGPVVAILDELLTLDDFDDELFPDRGSNR